MAAKKKLVIRKAEKLPDEDFLLLDDPVEPVAPVVNGLAQVDHKTLTNAVIDPVDSQSLLSRIQTLEARLNKSEAYAQNLSTQISMIRQTQDRLSQRIVTTHTGGMIRTSAT